MSSASVARKNRRRKQQTSLPPLKTELQATALSNSDSNLKRISNGSMDLDSNVTYPSKVTNETEKIVDLETTDATTNKGARPFGDAKPFSTESNCSFIKCDVSSQPLKKVFIEEERGFKVMDINESLQISNELVQEKESDSHLAIDLAYLTAKCFHNFSNFCHGLLGGISLLQCMLMYYILSKPFGEDTLQHFGFISQPINNLFNFLCVICCISAFDRFDLGNPKCLLKLLQRCNMKVIIIIIYPMCLFLSLSTANVDDRLSLYQRNATSWDSVKMEDKEQELFYWKSLNIIKWIGAIFCWAIVALEPDNNISLKYLENVKLRNKSPS